MFKNRTTIDKKKALLARKEQILLDLQYYETRIQEYTTKTTRQYDCSSDSEDDTPFPPFTLKVGPSLGELKQQEQLLRTCLQATQELSGLAVLQSEVNVLTKDPQKEGERPVSEPGNWREVTAECRIDMVPFSITFYTYQPRRKFAPTCYRGLHVLPVKKGQEAELAKSVLSSLKRPSDVIEVLRSYAVAFRSRRNTLARLADKYTNKLLLERLPEGGFMLKCGNLLSMSWTLENKHSSVVAFHHKMCFNLEYMDESYLKKIKPEHRKLADPSLQTDERTLILYNIIEICLEAQTQAQDMYESLESDQESVKKDKTTLSEDIDDNEDINRRKTDEEVMAPPKTIPKKAKPKGKENTDHNRKSVKRASETDGQNAKKAKIDAVDGRSKSITDLVEEKDMSEGNKSKVKKTTDKEQINRKGTDEVVSKEQINQKGDDKVDKQQKKHKVIEKAVDKKQMNQKKSDKVVDKPQTAEKSAEQSAKQSKAVIKNVVKPKNGDNSDKQKNYEKIGKKTDMLQTQSKVTDKNEKQNSNVVEKATSKNSKNTDKNSKNVDDKGAGSKHAKITKDNAKTQPKNTVEKDLNSKKVAKSDTNAKNVNNLPQLKKNVEKDSNAKTVANLANEKTTKNGQNDKITEKNGPKTNTDPKTAKAVTQNTKITKTANNTEKADKENKNDNQTTNTKNDKAIIHKSKEKNSAEKAISTTEKTKTFANIYPKKRFQTKIDTANKMADPKNKMADPKNNMADPKNKMADPKNRMDVPKTNIADPKHKMVAAKNKIKPKITLPSHRNSTAGVKKTILRASVSKESKIPQKKLSPNARVLQNNPVRASPRMMSKFKSSSDTNINSKLFKPLTNIPRLLKQTRDRSA